MLTPDEKASYELAIKRFESGATCRGRKSDLEHRAFTRVVVRSTVPWFSLTREAHEEAARLLRECVDEEKPL